MSLIYLACPYSHPDSAVRHARFDAVNRKAAELMAQGLHIISPISHTHPIAEAGQLPMHWGYWEAYDAAILSRCERMMVYALDGWQESVGVQAEIKIAQRIGLTVELILPTRIKCPRCGKDGKELHLCPHSSEINDDIEPCTCCASCEQSCCDDI